MAANIFTGATNSNWNTSTNWSLGAVPTGSDGNTATFDATSPNCTVNVSAVCNSIDFTGYTNTITMTNQIQSNGNITLDSGMLISGSGALVCAETATLTSDGKTWPNALTLQGTSKTRTLADDWTVTGLVNLAGATTNVLNGNNLYCQDSLTQANQIISGTTTIHLIGTGTWSVSGTTSLRNNLVFNTAGTITVSGTVTHNTGTITYVAGTIVTTGSTLTRNAVDAGDLDTAGMTWNNITIGTSNSTLTLLSDVNMTGTLSTGTATQTTFTGAFNMNVGGGLSIGTTGLWVGTASIVLNGTGSIVFGGSAPEIRINVTINTSGTITFNTSNPIHINTGTFTYVTGTVVTTGSTLAISNSATLNLNGLILDNLTLGNSAASAKTWTLNSGFVINGAFVCTGPTALNNSTLKSSSVGVQRVVTLAQGGTHQINFLVVEDIDSSQGVTIWNWRGTLSNASNWKSLVPPSTAAFAS